LAEAGSGRPEEAVRYLRRALELNPKLELARDRLAVVHFARGDFVEAAKLAESAQITSETSVEGVRAFVLSLERTGRVERAAALAEEAAAVMPASEGLYRELSALFERAGKTAKAEEFRALAQQTVNAERNKKTQ
jgi:tetratricopeptide (TPR) repeat protein